MNRKRKIKNIDSSTRSPVIRFDRLPCKFLELKDKHSLNLDCGVNLRNFRIAYKCYGKLNKNKTNAILVCHALTGDQFVSGTHPITRKKGWWDILVGPGKPLDTKKFFIICSNILGGCMGSTGPMDVNPKTKKLYGLHFPVITVGDMVNAQKLLIDHLGIEKLFCVIGGSLGGMQVLQWACNYPEKVFSAIAIATAAKHSAQNISFHEIGRQSIMTDPNWNSGKYFTKELIPSRGLSVARMIAHITYLSEEGLHAKFGRNLQDKKKITYGFGADFQVESYLRHQGKTFVERFDANSYLYITRAMDYFDLGKKYRGVLSNAFRGTKTRFCIISFSSDWLFPTSESLALVKALNSVNANVSFSEIETDKGHDSFLLNVPEFFRVVRNYLQGISRFI